MSYKRSRFIPANGAFVLAVVVWGCGETPTPTSWARPVGVRATAPVGEATAGQVLGTAVIRTRGRMSEAVAQAFVASHGLVLVHRFHYQDVLLVAYPSREVPDGWDAPRRHKMRRSAYAVAGLAFASMISFPGCRGTEATDPACEPVVQLAANPRLTLADVPDDSSVSSVLRWPGGVPSGTAETLRARGITVIHAFHFQPVILVWATGRQLRELQGSDPGVQVTLDTVVQTPALCAPGV